MWFFVSKNWVPITRAEVMMAKFMVGEALWGPIIKTDIKLAVQIKAAIQMKGLMKMAHRAEMGMARERFLVMISGLGWFKTTPRIWLQRMMETTANAV